MGTMHPRWTIRSRRWAPFRKQGTRRRRTFRLARHRWRVWRGALGLMLLGVAAVPSLHWANRWLYQRQRAVTAPFLTPLSVAALGDRVAIIAPHPDDETLGCAGLIQTLLARGIAPYVLVVTDGDGFDAAIRLCYHQLRVTDELRRAFAARRRGETLAAMARLGLPLDRVHFLGFSERTLPARWLLHGDETPLRALLEWLVALRPTAVFVPSRYDDHPVHAAVASLAWAAVLQACAQGALSERPRVLEFLVHYGEFPRPQGWHPTLDLLPPAELVPVALWHRLPLAAPLRDRKARALACYRTQLPLTGRFLKSFVRANELFAEPLPLSEQPDRAGEPRSLLPGADIVEVAVLPHLRARHPTLRLTVRLRGKPLGAYRYGAHLFAPGADRPHLWVTVAEKAPDTSTLAFDLPLPAPPALGGQEPLAVVTAFVTHRERMLDVAPLTPKVKAGAFHVP